MRSTISLHLLLFVLSCIFFVNRASCALVAEERQFFEDLIAENPLFSIPNGLDEVCSWVRINCSEDNTHVLYLDLARQRIDTIPHSIANLTRLRVLELASLRIGDQGIERLLPLSSLVVLSLTQTNVFELPQTFGYAFPNLERLELPNSLVSLPIGFNELKNLRDLIYRFGNPDHLDRLCGLPNLERLDLSNLQAFSLPECFNNGLPRLRHLTLSWSSIRGFPNIFGLTSLEELHAPMASLQGIIPAQIGNLKNLRILNMQRCGLLGSIPPTISELQRLENLLLGDNTLLGSIPPSIGRLKNLRQLVLGSNTLTETIPETICDLENLESLNLGNNQLSGSIPNCIGRMTRLENFLLSHNTLVGTVPASIGALTSLTTLQFSNNQLTGTLPDEIGNLVRLDVLSCDNNQLSGTLPSTLQNLQRLLIFHASFNNFEGPLFNISNMLRLEFCEVQFNSLTGQLPDYFTSACELSNFQAQSNNLTGTLPQTLQNLNYLINLNLGNNRIGGTIPELLFSRPARLSTVDLSDNLLTGTLPPITTRLRSLFLENNNLFGTIPALINATVLNFIDLSQNFFDGTLPPLSPQLLFVSFATNLLTGTFPVEYVQVPGLSTLDLADNHLFGPLPVIPQNTPFRHLDLSSNRLNGTIPAALISQSIQTLILSNNQFAGTLPTYNSLAFNLNTLRLDNNRIGGNVPRAQFTLMNLEVLDLSGNYLRGNLPAVTQRLRRLRIVNISHNFLSGVLPPSLSNIVNLEELDLSVNDFIGTIPSQFGTLPRLNRLNLAVNHLTGGIPESFAGHETLSTLILSTNQLSGTVPEYIGELLNLQQLDLSANFFIGTIPQSLGMLRGLHYLYMTNNHLSGQIPASLFSLQRLRRLDLSQNALSGTIPKEITNARLLEKILLSQNQLSGTLPSLMGLTEVIEFHVASNNLVGCIQLPRIFENARNSSVAACSIDNNHFCCSRHDYLCSSSDYCPLEEALIVTSGQRVPIEERYKFPRLVIKEDGTLVISPETKLEAECVTILGTVEVDVSELEEEAIDVSFLLFSCGETRDMKVTAVGIGKKCEVASTVVENVDTKRQFTAKIVCPNNALPEGTIIAIIVSVTGGFLLVIVIGGVTYRYFRGKRRVEQLLNRVELLTLTTKNGSDDQFSLPQWHAPEDYSLKPVEDLPIQLTNTKFDFGTKGNLLQVDSMYKDLFRVQSRTKINQSRGLVQRLLEKSLRVNFHPVQSTKYQLTIDPFEIDIRDKGYVDVTLMLQMKMTTRTNISLWVEVPELKQFSLLEFVCASEPSPWIDIDEVDGVTEALGEGGFGAVYKAKYRGQTIAFKKLKFQDMNIQQFEEFNREVQMMMNLHHRCIVQFIGASKVPGKLAILTEFVSGGNLQELLNSRPSLDTGLKLKIALDVAEALQFLHANNILHRDIKAENVLVASTAKEASVNVKLTDFGTARSIVEEVTMKFTKGIGTPTYMAPEIMENKRYEKGADIYSFGILLWTIMAQQMPYSHLEHPWQIANMVIAGGRLPIPPSTPVAVAELINKCWAQSPDDRPNMDQVVKELEFIVASKM